jgi:hypothetical protein
MYCDKQFLQWCKGERPREKDEWYYNEKKDLGNTDLKEHSSVNWAYMDYSHYVFSIVRKKKNFLESTRQNIACLPVSLSALMCPKLKKKTKRGGGQF